jgi:hypothetical protein
MITAGRPRLVTGCAGPERLAWRSWPQMKATNGPANHCPFRTGGMPPQFRRHRVIDSDRTIAEVARELGNRRGDVE